MNAGRIEVRNSLFASVFPALLMCGSCAAQNQAVDARLAEMVEEVVAKTGLSVNVSRVEMTSVNIDRINGRDVCASEAAGDVKRLQAAFIEHPNIHESFSIYMISITKPDGRRTQTDFSVLREKGVFASDCISLYASVHGIDSGQGTTLK